MAMSTTEKDLQAIRRQIANEERELERTLRIIRKKKAKRDALRSSLALHKSLVTPVRRLPVEILAMIFVCYMESGHDKWPFVLGLVCRHWREVQLATPAVWSYIYVSPLDTDCKGVVPAKLKTWLRRAASHPLSLEVSLVPCFRLLNLPLSSEDTKVRCEYLSRQFKGCAIRSLHITASCETHEPDAILNHVLGLLQSCQLSHLESLRLALWPLRRATSQAIVTALRLVLTGAQRLHSVQLPISWLPKRLTVLSRLESLWIDGPAGTATGTSITHASGRLDAILQLLNGASGLTSLTIGSGSGWASTLTFPDTLPAITLPAVESLYLTGINNPLTFFRNVRLPALRTLRMRYMDNAINVGASLNAFIDDRANDQVYGLRLETLHFEEYAPYSMSTLIPILDRLPTLVTLWIPYGRLTHKFVEAFIREGTPRKGWLCPNLRNLILDCKAVSLMATTWSTLIPDDLEELVHKRVHEVSTSAGQGYSQSGEKDSKKIVPKPVRMEQIMWDEVDLISQFP